MIKFLVASIAQAFFLFELIAEGNVCGFCARNLLMYLHDVHPATLHMYVIDFVTIGLDQGWQMCGLRVVGKKFLCFIDNQGIYNKKVISPPEKNYNVE